MNKVITLVFAAILVPSVSSAAALTTDQATSLISVVQSSPETPASAFVPLITAFSNITVGQAESLITVVQASPGTAAEAFVSLLTSFTVDPVVVPPAPVTYGSVATTTPPTIINNYYSVAPTPQPVTPPAPVDKSGIFVIDITKDATKDLNRIEKQKYLDNPLRHIVRVQVRDKSGNVIVDPSEYITIAVDGVIAQTGTDQAISSSDNPEGKVYTTPLNTFGGRIFEDSFHSLSSSITVTYEGHSTNFTLSDLPEGKLYNPRNPDVASVNGDGESVNP